MGYCGLNGHHWKNCHHGVTWEFGRLPSYSVINYIKFVNLPVSPLCFITILFLFSYLEKDESIFILRICLYFFQCKRKLCAHVPITSRLRCLSSQGLHLLFWTFPCKVNRCNMQNEHSARDHSVKALLIYWNHGMSPQPCQADLWSKCSEMQCYLVVTWPMLSIIHNSTEWDHKFLEEPWMPKCRGESLDHEPSWTPVIISQK